MPKGVNFPRRLIAAKNSQVISLDTMASDLLNALTTINDLDVSEAQANFISTSGLLLAFFGIITAGSTILGAISTLFGIGAVSVANDWRIQIAEERFLRSTTTPVSTTTTTTTTTLDPSKNSIF